MTLLWHLLFSCFMHLQAIPVTTPAHQMLVPPSLIVLGTLQDGGSPHAGCNRTCCRDLFDHPDPERRVVSLGLVDPGHNATFLFEATPDLPEQMKALKGYAPYREVETPDAILLTHAHIGHYTGLIHLGREVMHATGVPVYAMPRMKAFLENNGPWSQLVTLGNIKLLPLQHQQTVQLTPNVTITPFLVPHRDEFSETVGFRISGPAKTAVFIPDIDKWERWDVPADNLIRSVDYALIDGSFFDSGEIPGRDMSEIPHPFVVESMALLESFTPEERQKVWFIHLNHTNPLLDSTSVAYRLVTEKGFRVASVGVMLEL
jgi:pyrroloquinoline quinone biosynthesis protein B